MYRPSRSMVILSDISKTSFSLCEIKMIPVPLAFSRRDSDSRRCDDSSEVGIRPKESDRLVVALLPEVVSVDYGDKAHIRVLGKLQFFLHPLDPNVLVGHS